MWKVTDQCSCLIIHVREAFLCQSVRLTNKCQSRNDSIFFRLTLLLDEPTKLSATIFGDTFYLSNRPCFSTNTLLTSIVMSRNASVAFLWKIHKPATITVASDLVPKLRSCFRTKRSQKICRSKVGRLEAV